MFIMPPRRDAIRTLARSSSLELRLPAGAPEAKEAAPVPVPAWLTELNRWRQMAGLPAIVENGRLSYGSEQHARYLVEQSPPGLGGFRAYDRTIGPRAHIEDARSRSYTPVGAEAAIGGALAPNIIQGADVAWEGRSAPDDIEDLLVAPFHRLSLLAPWARVAGYGSFGEYPRRAAALALRGPLGSVLARGAVEFPPASATVSFNAMAGVEWPNPIAGCGGYRTPTGLPISLQTGRSLALRSYTLNDETSNESITVCAFDAAGYRDPDPIQQKRGRELLNAYGAIVLVPQNPLRFGHQYRVAVSTSRGDFAWSFTISAPPPVEETRAERAAVRPLADAK